VIPSTRRLVWALLAAELVCAVAWALTGNLWWCLGALLVGLALVAAVMSSGR
jgi:uncharacterized membrane protein